MTKSEYLNQLQKYLKRLPKTDYENTMEHFTEYLDDIDDAHMDQAMQELGTPKEAASELLKNLLDAQLNTDGKSKKAASIGKIILISLLTIFAAPLGLPVIATVAALAITGILLLFCVLLLGLCLCLVFVLAAAKLIVRGIVAFTVSVSGGLLIVGMGIFCIGCSILLSMLMIYSCRWIGRGIAAMTKRISR